MTATGNDAGGSPKKRRLLLCIDDDPHDIEFLGYSLESAGLNIELIGIEDGTQGLRYLRKEGDYADAPTPDVIFLDLNMPRKDGREVLADIKADERLKKIPVVIFTTSDSKFDVSKSYDGGADCFLTKPVGLEECAKIVQVLANLMPLDEVDKP